MKTAIRPRWNRPGVVLPTMLAGALLIAACLAQVTTTQKGAAGLRQQISQKPPANTPVKSSTEGEPRAAANAVAPTFDPNTDLVVFPAEEVGFIVGPQLRSGSARNPYTWFDRVASEHGHLHGRAAPRVAPRDLTGTVTVRRGAAVVEGAGTRFLSEVDPSGPAPLYNGWLRVRMPGGATHVEAKVVEVVSDTRLVLAAPWGGESATGAAADTFHFDAQRGAWNYDVYYDSNYYDLALTQYTNYYRTGDARFLEYARRTADAWWGSPYIGHGTVVGGPNALSPRGMAYAGLMLRALDGRPEMWDYLERQVRAQFDNWVVRRIADPTLYYDMREDGFAQLYAVLLARVLPDGYSLYEKGTQSAATGRAADGAAKRAALLRDAERAAVDFFGRLQRPDGSWRWDVGGSYNLVNVEQPFMVGLYLESAIALDRLTTDAKARTSLRSQIVRACRHLYKQAYRGQEVVADMPRYRWRGMWYFWGGGTAQNPTAYAQGDGERVTKGDPNMIRVVRHLNSTVHHAFGYAYALTGDAEFLRMGDEVFDASFGERVDGLHGLADEGRAKNYAMNFRASGRYLAWRLTGEPQRPSSGATPLATPRTVTAAPAELPAELIATAFSTTQRLSQSSALGEADVKELIDQIERARSAFADGDGKDAAPSGVLEELQAALQHAGNALAAVKAGPDYDTARLRLEWAAARLKRAKERAQRK